LTFATNQKLSDSARDCGTVLVTKTWAGASNHIGGCRRRLFLAMSVAIRLRKLHRYGKQ